MYCPDLPLDPPEPKYYICPMCGDEITGNTRLYKTIGGEIVGCEVCISAETADDLYGDD